MWTNRRNIFQYQSQLPTPIIFNSDLLIYYSHRVKGKSHIGRIVLDGELKIIDINPNVLGLGKTGCFDDSGVMPSCVVEKENQLWMYYSGWNINKGGVPYGHGIGLAIGGDCKFNRISDGPIIDRSTRTPYLSNSPFVVNEELYFCNGCGWDGNFPKYQISKCSGSGVHWSFVETILGDINEANSRPCVIIENNTRKIWSAFKTKKTQYRIRYFENEILKNDDVLPISKTGWDSEMTCYPYVFDLGSRRLMFYNGNGYGETGFGVAEWSQR